MTELRPTSDLASQTDHASRFTRVVLLVVAAAAIGILFWMFRSELTLSRLALREAAFRQYRLEHPVLVYVVAFAIYVIVTGLSLPGAAAMTLLIGWLFGFWRSVLLVSIASTAGATVAFLLSRYLLRDSIARRFGERLSSFNASLQTEGAFYLFTLRMIPAIPFFVVNAVMGLTPIRVSTFWWVSQIGMLPGTIVFVYAGSSVPNLQLLAEKGVNAVFTPGQMAQILVAFVLLGLFPLAVRALMKRLVKAL